MSVVTPQMEVEKLAALGKELGLEGKELREFIREEREQLRKRRDEERAQRNEERAHEKARLELEAEKAKIEAAKETDRARAEEERMKLQHKFKQEEAMRLEAIEEKALEREERSLQLQIQVEDKRVKVEETKALHAEIQAKNPTQASSNKSQPYKAPKLPKFDEDKDNMDAYIVRFERYAAAQKWDKEHWAVNLGTLLTGKGLMAYYSLSIDEVNDYDILKKTLLKRYELTEEGFRDKFRNSKPDPSETASQYITRVTNYLKRWFDLSGIEKSFEGLVFLLIKDQFVHSCPKELGLYVKEHCPRNTDELAEVADRYIEAHKSWWPFPKGKNQANKGKPTYNPQSGNRGNQSNFQQHQRGQSYQSQSYQGQFNRNRPTSTQTNFRSNVNCFVCGKHGHRARECPNRGTLAALVDNADVATNQYGQQTFQDGPVQNSEQVGMPHSLNSQNCDIANYSNSQCEAMQNQTGNVTFSSQQVGPVSSFNPQSAVFRPSVTTGRPLSTNTGVLSQSGNTNTHILGYIATEHDPHISCACEKGYLALKCGHNLKVMSAACQHNQGRKKYLRMGKVGKHDVLTMRDSGCDGVVVKKAYVKPEQYTGGHRVCLLIDGTVRRYPVAEIFISTPFYTGKTLASCMDEPVRDLIVGNIPGVKDPDDLTDSPDTAEQKQISTKMDCKQAQKQTSESTLQEVERFNVEAAVETRAQRQARTKPMKPLIVTAPDEEDVTPETLSQKQQDDPSLRKVRELTESGEEKESRGGGKQRFIKENGIIYREFEAPNIEFGDKFKQVVVPTEYRSRVMKLAHESLLGGHQGVKKTSDKILTNFYWPGMGADVHRYCQSCDVCQRTIPKGRITKIPLGDMPLIETPFERVAVDLVGPIAPATERGHRYILVLVDYATRYPEAIPLKSIDTEVVAEALLTMFSHLGIPREMLTDKGTQFVSNLMKEVSRLLSIRRLTTTPYHAMGNGLVERYNGTLKQMLKKMAQERPKDWDRYVAPLLFAYRETPQESTGFSPFELLYGRTIRGPMAILKELWTGQTQEAETKTTYQYILDLQERLEGTCHLARQELERAKSRQKVYYNKKARQRSYEVGDEVLLLIPTDHNKILMQWKGPFKIKEKLNSMNYRIDLGHRSQTYHANLLKKYHRRPEVASSCIQWEDHQETVFELSAVSVIEETDDDMDMADQPRFGMDEMHLPPMVAKESISDLHINPGLDKTQTIPVKRIMGNFKGTLTDLPTQTNLGNHTVVVTDETPIRRRPYPIPHSLREEVQQDIENMLKMGVISRSNSPYAFPLVAVRKSDGTLRSCVDMRLLNQITVFDAEPVPDQEEIFSKLSRDRYFTKIDLSKGYWQIPMDEASKKYTSFVTHSGLYTFNVMPFGLVNAGATFSRIMRKLLMGLKNVDNYIDDILIHTVTWEEHLEKLTEVLKRLRQANLTAKPSKCFIGYENIEFLGHIVGGGKIRPKPDKIEAIRQAKEPETKTQVRSFMGLAGYYRKFIPDFAAIASPITDCTQKGRPNKIQWGNCEARAFHTLKTKLTSSPILHLPDLKKEFVLRTDASDKGIGAVLLQEHMGQLFPVAYISKKLSKRQRAYSIMEKECLAIVWAIQKFSVYLYGRQFVIQTDHQPLSCIRRSKIANARIMRWALALQPYRYRLEVIKGSQNVGADYMSRISAA